jgi:hypothetical protein
MEQFVTQANVDHCLELLNRDDISSRNRSTVSKLLIEEENKLGHRLAQLEFAEKKAAACRNRADRQKLLLDSFNPSSPEWMQAERLLVNFESLAQFVEGFCQQMRRQVNGSRL